MLISQIKAFIFFFLLPVNIWGQQNNDLANPQRSTILPVTEGKGQGEYCTSRVAKSSYW